MVHVIYIDKPEFTAVTCKRLPWISMCTVDNFKEGDLVFACERVTGAKVLTGRVLEARVNSVVAMRVLKSLAGKEVDSVYLGVDLIDYGFLEELFECESADIFVLKNSRGLPGMIFE